MVQEHLPAAFQLFKYITFSDLIDVATKFLRFQLISIETNIWGFTNKRLFRIYRIEKNIEMLFLCFLPSFVYGLTSRWFCVCLRWQLNKRITNVVFCFKELQNYFSGTGTRRTGSHVVLVVHVGRCFFGVGRLLHKFRGDCRENLLLPTEAGVAAARSRRRVSLQTLLQFEPDPTPILYIVEENNRTGVRAGKNSCRIRLPIDQYV